MYDILNMREGGWMIMTFEFAKYPDGTLGVFSNIGKKENGEEYLRVTFERPME